MKLRTNFKITLTVFLCTLFFSSCFTTQTTMLSSRSAQSIQSMHIMRPLAIIDWLDNENSKVDSSELLSGKMEERIMDALEKYIPQNIGLQYFNPKAEEYQMLDSCLDLIKYKILVSGDLYVTIPKPLRDVMARDKVNTLLYIQTSGFQRSRENYLAQKNAVFEALAASNYEEGYQEAVGGKALYMALIIDRERNNVIFYNEVNAKGKSVVNTEIIDQAVIRLFDGYFYRYKKGVFEEIPSKK